VKYWEIIADNLSKAGWSWGCVSAIDFNGQTIWIARRGWWMRSAAPAQFGEDHEQNSAADLCMMSR
jgi:hypothetical protein